MIPHPRPPTTLRWIRSVVFNQVPFLITCQQLEDFIVDYLEDELLKRQKFLFELHLMICSECRGYLAAYRQTMELAKQVSGNERSPIAKKMPEDLIRAIHAARRLDI